MRGRHVTALALAVAACFGGRAYAEETAAAGGGGLLPALGAGLSLPALVAGGVAAALVASRIDGGDDPVPSGAPEEGGSGGGSGGPAPGPTRTLAYSSAVDFRTSEYRAQAGLDRVGAASLYWNGHYAWYAGSAPDAAAGTGAGVKIAVGDTGINAAEASSGGAIAIDTASSYDFIAGRAGPGEDSYGHGTHVAGIIAAPKNGAGMHGLAYNATIVNFKVGNATISATDEQLGDMIRRAGAAGAMVLNNSWASPTVITSLSAAEAQAMMPRMIEAAREYVAAGGVVVFAAGNGAGAQPSMQAGLPHRAGGLEAGWLAVVALDNAGALAAYSSRCGVAAAWCLAAPGGELGAGLYSMQNNGGYAWMYGTSMAAPHVSAAIGALKSMFPNLTYLQIRERVLFTANRSGAYANADLYGQGMLDLAAASAPVGGLSVASGTQAAGATAPLEQTSVVLPAGAAAAMNLQGSLLVLDNYQRAPFYVPAATVFRESAPRMVERQWASLRSGRDAKPEKSGFLRFSHAGGVNTVLSADYDSYRFGFSSGRGGEATLGAHLGLAWVPGLAKPGLDSVAMGYAALRGGVRLGLVGTLPAPGETREDALESSPLGSRRALGLVAQSGAAESAWGFSLALAEDFERPVGIESSGAFALDASAAASAGAFVRQALGARSHFRASLELAEHRPRASGALATPAYALTSASLGAAIRVGGATTLSADLRRDWASGAAALSAPATIDASGTIGRRTYALSYDDLVGRTSYTLRLDHALSKTVELRLGLTHERSGFGASATGFAALVEIAL